MRLILRLFILFIFHNTSYAQYQNLALLPTSVKVSINNANQGLNISDIKAAANLP